MKNVVKSLHPQWVVGFVDGEGCFRASVLHNPKLRFETQIQMEFVVVQHERDIDLLYKLKSFWNCGQISKGKGQKGTTDHTVRFRVRKLSDLLEKIIPFFEKHSLKTKKKIEFLRFRRLCMALHRKMHLEKEGFDQCLLLARNIPFTDSELNYNPNIQKLNEYLENSFFLGN